jgi:hypothetical protein
MLRAMVLTGMVVSLNARANMADPWRTGEAAGEPIGVMKHLHVREERLEIDLRPLAQPDEAARLTAEYVIENRSGEPVTTELFFVAPGLKSGTVELDGVALQSSTTWQEVPESWLDIQKQQRGRSTSGLSYVATLAPGEHLFKVAYLARASEDHVGGVYLEQVVSYALGPAKEWASFGSLDLVVHPPVGWRVESSIGLKADTDGVLGARLEGVPADFWKLRLSRDGSASLLPWMALLAGLLLPPLLGVQFGRRRILPGPGGGARGLAAAGLLVASLVIVVAGWSLAVWLAGPFVSAGWPAPWTALVCVGLVDVAFVGLGMMFGRRAASVRGVSGQRIGP